MRECARSSRDTIPLPPVQSERPRIFDHMSSRWACPRRLRHMHPMRIAIVLVAGLGKADKK
ncbi:hypothetical protein M378DRAFT_157334 [Amanita muscaria Koide BX008]|uniref:Uncharacterized protein n=1 Tax=Amanita muscaria (strain Koide BX008) TaxID=946122 RepID=A0A0C2TPH0_AMAMK|nr:hypothetical protein M378DRAFT_157334 [Amanita muscaria Koide BX008]